MSPFDINSVVFHFDDFNDGRRSQPYFFNNCNSAGVSTLLKDMLDCAQNISTPFGSNYFTSF
jgi:hypothetical protein